MSHDADPEVRRVVAGRMSPEVAVVMLRDSDWRVRLTAVGRVPPAALATALEDEDRDVRDAARQRSESLCARRDGVREEELQDE